MSNSKALGPFHAIVGDGIPITAYILSETKEVNSKDEGEKTQGTQAGNKEYAYVLLIRKTPVTQDADQQTTQQEATEVTLYQVVTADNDEKENDGRQQLQLFKLTRSSSIEIYLEHTSADKLLVESTQKKSNRVLLSSFLEADVTTYKNIISRFSLQQINQDNVMIMSPPTENNRILFGKIEAEIFQRSLEHHTEILNKSNIDSPEEEDSKPKATTKGRRKRSCSVVVSLR